jgi:hypothetical protein
MSEISFLTFRPLKIRSLYFPEKTGEQYPMMQCHIPEALILNSLFIFGKTQERETRNMKKKEYNIYTAQHCLFSTA